MGGLIRGVCLYNVIKLCKCKLYDKSSFSFYKSSEKTGDRAHAKNALDKFAMVLNISIRICVQFHESSISTRFHRGQWFKSTFIFFASMFLKIEAHMVSRFCWWFSITLKKMTCSGLLLVILCVCYKVRTILNTFHVIVLNWNFYSMLCQDFERLLVALIFENHVASRFTLLSMTNVTQIRLLFLNFSFLGFWLSLFRYIFIFCK